MAFDLYAIVEECAAIDAKVLVERDKSYGSSWKKRGGVGAFMMLARKWDRIENIVQGQNYDVFRAIENDWTDTGILDDIRDLRRYLLLVEAEMLRRSYSDNVAKDNVIKGQCYAGQSYREAVNRAGSAAGPLTGGSVLTDGQVTAGGRTPVYFYGTPISDASEK